VLTNPARTISAVRTKAQPFDWNFTRAELAELMVRLAARSRSFDLPR
jgi:hypothetical protein